MKATNWKVTLRLRSDLTVVRNFYADTAEDAVRLAVWNHFNRAFYVQPEPLVEDFYSIRAGGKTYHADVASTDEVYAVNYVRGNK